MVGGRKLPADLTQVDDKFPDSQTNFTQFFNQELQAVCVPSQHFRADS